MAPSTQLSISFLEKLTNDMRPMVEPKPVRPTLFRRPKLKLMSLKLIPESSQFVDALSVTFAILFSLFMWGNTIS